MKGLVFIPLFWMLTVASVSYADEDPYTSALQGYQSDRLTKADAHAINIYDSWSDNMAHLIVSGNRPGKVIDPNDPSGTGNLVIEKGAKINGPVIYKPTIKDTITIVKPMKR